MMHNRKVFHHVLAQDIYIGDTILTDTYFYKPENTSMYSNLITVDNVTIIDHDVRIEGKNSEMIDMCAVCQWNQLIAVVSNG